jgi:hypothetical protein
VQNDAQVRVAYADVRKATIEVEFTKPGPDEIDEGGEE